MDDRKNLTMGPVAGKLLLFALPIIATNLLQALYNIGDMVIIGQLTGSAGISAVSMGGMATAVVTSMANGFTNGGTALVSQLYGAGRKDETPRLIGTMLTGFTALAVIVTLAAIFLAKPIMIGLGTPEESLTGAIRYLMFCGGGFIFVFWYNTLTACLRAVGESVWPMIFALVTVVLNLGLDYLFVGPLGWGASGAAIATVISQLVAMVLAIWYIRKVGMFRFHLKDFMVDWKKLGVALRIGFPQAVQLCLTTLSFLLISRFVNLYGVDASAAVGVISKITSFVVLPSIGMMSAMIAFTGQNLPSQNYKRITKAGWISVAVGCGFSALCSICILLWPKALMGLFTTDAAVLEMGANYFRVQTISYLVESCLFVIYGMLIGSGHTLHSLICSVISAMVVRYALAWAFTTFTDMGFIGISWAYVLAPSAALIAAAIMLICGVWKKSSVNI